MTSSGQHEPACTFLKQVKQWLCVFSCMQASVCILWTECERHIWYYACIQMSCICCSWCYLFCETVHMSSQQNSFFSSNSSCINHPGTATWGKDCTGACNKLSGSFSSVCTQFISHIISMNNPTKPQCLVKFTPPLMNQSCGVCMHGMLILVLKGGSSSTAVTVLSVINL